MPEQAEEVEQAEEAEPDVKILKFKADWCGPCKQQSEILDGLFDENEDVEVLEVDVEEDQDVASEYNVRSLPTLVLRQQDPKETLARFAGLTGAEELEEEVAEAL